MRMEGYKLRYLAAILAAILLAGALAGCGGTAERSGEEEKPQDPPFVIMITDAGGLGDHAFNDSIRAGIKRAQDELGVQADVLEPEKGNLEETFIKALNKSPDLVICAGSGLAETVKNAAADNPDQKFVLIDDDSVDAPKVACLTFNEEEGSFLAGVAAATASKSEKVGFLGGEDIAVIEKFRYGYEAGVKSINPDAEVLVEYTGSFTDVDKGREKALALNSQGADVIYHASGACGRGAVSAAEEKGFWLIGVDQDQSFLSPRRVLCSMVKRVDNAAYIAVKQVAEGTFSGRNHVFTLAEGGVGISDHAGNLTSEIKERLSKWSEAIVNGDFEVPYTKSAFQQFQPPRL